MIACIVNIISNLNNRKFMLQIYTSYWCLKITDFQKKSKILEINGTISMLLYGMQIADGCQSWEIWFIVQAFCSTDLLGEFSTTIEKAHEFIKKSQVDNSPCFIKKYIFRTNLTIIFPILKVLSNSPSYQKNLSPSIKRFMDPFNCKHWLGCVWLYCRGY